MKKIILLLVFSLTFYSCGEREKKEQIVEETKIDKLTVIINALYEKDDIIDVYYKKEGYFVDKPVQVKLSGSSLPQQITIELPEGEIVENLSINLSSNKEQGKIAISSVIVKNNEDIILSDKENFTTYFLFNESVSWDPALSRYIMIYDKEIPPAMGGGEQLEALLMK